MTAAEVAAFLARYRRSFDGPVETRTTVEHVRRRGDGFEVGTDRGNWHADNVVIATGWSDQPAVPAIAARLHPAIQQQTPASYRHPGQLTNGGVLVVGASATGVQLADELRLAGREVYLAVGSHTRMPRHYRGRDIFWWLDQIGARDRTVDEMRSTAEAQREPSLQLVGRTGGGEVNLATLFAPRRHPHRPAHVRRWDARQLCRRPRHQHRQAERRLNRVLDRIDANIATYGLADETLPHEPLLHIPAIDPLRRLDLRDGGVATVIWATGHRRSYPWLHVPGAVADGELAHRYGISPVPGLYVLGQRFQRTRRSTFVDGVGADAVVVTHHLLARHRPRLQAVA